LLKEAIGVGNTVEEATEQALLLLSAKETDDIQFDVISTPKKKTFGLFGGSQAKVRAFIELPDPKPTNQINKPVSTISHRKIENPATTLPPKKVVRSTVKESVVPKKVEIKAEKRSEFDFEAEGVPFEQVNPSSPAGKSAAYLKIILEQLGCKDVKMTIAENDSGASINLEGENLGIVIGRRGETLDALQYLSSLAANSKEIGYFRIVLNIGNYREKREKALQGLARKTAFQVIRTGHSRSLEPMNPYERRIIHTVVQDIVGVTSNSIGDGSSRRVVISPVGSTNTPTNNRFASRPQIPRPASAPVVANPILPKNVATIATPVVQPVAESNVPSTQAVTDDTVVNAEPVAESPAPVSKKIDISKTPLYGRIDK